MCIIKGARNLENAKKFYDWALTPGGAGARRPGQVLSGAVEQGRRRCRPRRRSSPTIKLIDYDFAKYGSSAERKRLLAKWDDEVGALPQALMPTLR